jgi:predicted CoA-binding protein
MEYQTVVATEWNIKMLWLQSGISNCCGYRIEYQTVVATEWNIKLLWLQNGISHCCGYRVEYQTVVATEWNIKLLWLQSGISNCCGYRVEYQTVVATEWNIKLLWLQNGISNCCGYRVEYQTVVARKFHCQLKTMPSAVTETKRIKKQTDFRLQSRSRPELHSSELLRNEQWCVLTDVSEEAFMFTDFPNRKYTLRFSPTQSENSITTAAIKVGAGRLRGRNVICKSGVV